MGLTLNGRKVLARTLLRGQEFILDADEDSSLTADTDDQLDLRLGGNDVFVFKTSELDISGVNIVNCGDIALDSISDDDGTGINIAMMDTSATALTIQEAANAYLTFDTSNGTENIILGKKLTGGAVEIEGSAFDINGGTIGGVTLDGAIACGDQGLTGVGDMTFTAGSILAAAAANTSTLLVKGGGLAGTTLITVTSLDAGDTLGLANVNSFVAVGNLNIGAHDFTAATLIGANVTSGADPGHTHTGASLSGVDISADTNLAVTAPIVLTDDTLSHSAANGYVHIPASGASAQILQYSSAGTAKWVTLSSDVTIADGGAMTVADDSHNHVYSNIDETTSANWIGRVSDETGTGAWVFANTPTLVTPVLGAATGTSLDLGGTTLLASRALTVDTGGVFNIVLASAAGDDFTVDTDKLVVEGDTGNVGIGTTGPGEELSVYKDQNSATVTRIDNPSTGAAGQSVFAAHNSAQYNVLGMLSTGYTTSGAYQADGGYLVTNGAGGLSIGARHTSSGVIRFYTDGAADGNERMRIANDGKVGIGTMAPSQILDVNDGSGNMIADGYDSHPSFLADKIDPVPMDNVLAKFKQVTPYEYKRIPYVSAEELAAAAIEEFGEEKWETAFPDGYRGGKLKDCPSEEIKAFLDNLADQLRAERQEWPEYQRLHYSLALDDLADTFPDILSRNKDGDVTGYSLNNYVGLLHACITELVEKVERLEAGGQ